VLGDCVGKANALGALSPSKDDGMALGAPSTDAGASVTSGTGESVFAVSPQQFKTSPPVAATRGTGQRRNSCEMTKIPVSMQGKGGHKTTYLGNIDL